MGSGDVDVSICCGLTRVRYLALSKERHGVFVAGEEVCIQDTKILQLAGVWVDGNDLGVIAPTERRHDALQPENSECYRYAIAP